MMNNDSILLTAVVRRDCGEEFTSFFKKHGSGEIYSVLCEGTAHKKTLDLLGLEYREKIIICCCVPKANLKLIMRQLVYEMRIDAPDMGIAFTIPYDFDISGAEEKKADTDYRSSYNNDGDYKMNDVKYSLVVAVAERGCSDMVMDAARKAGAVGGTVIHAKGTGKVSQNKFFGLSISNEKEMIYIVTKTSLRDEIIKSINKNAGIETEAGTIIFSLPVESVAGLINLEND